MPCGKCGYSLFNESSCQQMFQALWIVSLTVSWDQGRVLMSPKQSCHWPSCWGCDTQNNAKDVHQRPPADGQGNHCCPPGHGVLERNCRHSRHPCPTTFPKPSSFKQVHSRTPRSQTGTQRGVGLERLIFTSLGNLKWSQVGEQKL